MEERRRWDWKEELNAAISLVQSISIPSLIGPSFSVRRLESEPNKAECRFLIGSF